jgi:hypothetical protein
MWKINFKNDDGSVTFYFNGAVYAELGGRDIIGLDMIDVVKRASSYILDMVQGILESEDFDNNETKSLLSATADSLNDLAQVL